MSAIRICNCNKTMPLDGKAIAEALGEAEALPVHTELCRKQAGLFVGGLKTESELIVACTQERALFGELAAAEGSAGVPIRFVNIRETGGWSSEAKNAMPKIAALLAAEALPIPEPVPSVAYRSAGTTLIIGARDAAMAWAERLKEQLAVSVLIRDDSPDQRTAMAFPEARAYPVFSGGKVTVSGWLGAFEATWSQANPIDLEACTRCGKCVAVCPENAIGLDLQIDLDRCRDHRDCVKACGAIGAIDFARSATQRSGRYDLILDLSERAILTMHQPPQGYFAPGLDAVRQFTMALELVQCVGEFEKPKFFVYKEKICAHSRSEQVGCTACIDVCSTRAIASNGDKIRVEPHLCMGCGACTTVCPSGALGYAYPRPPDLGARLKTMLATYRKAGGRDALLLLHSPKAGAARVAELGRLASVGRLSGFPARVMPFEVFHTASVGLDIWLAAIAWGANQIAVLVTGEEAPDYLLALQAQMDVGAAILAGLGYGGRHLHLLAAASAEALDTALHGLAPAVGVTRPATFAASSEKRTTLTLALDHLVAASPRPEALEALPSRAIALPGASPFGRVVVDTAACTLCMACVGACPESALADNADAPQLRFIERNCVQCGLCEKTCPENAITLEPRLALGPEARIAQVVNEAQPFHCIRCNKPFGTAAMIRTMIEKIGGHAMFAGDAVKRLSMCSDCRVIDMMTAQNETTVHDLKRH